MADLVYPGATHTRFSHSVGVFHIARNLIKHLEGRGISIPNPSLFLSAALLHDIGHGPFSHVFERVYERLGLSVEHETISAEIIRSKPISEIFEKHELGYTPDAVADFICRKDGPRTVERQLLASQLDADRLDYILRDQAMTGTKVGTIDYNWLLDNMREEVDANGRLLAINPKAIAAAELYILNLFALYSTVYLHKTTRGAETILCEIIFRVFRIVEDRSHRRSIGVPARHSVMEFLESLVDLRKRGSLSDLNVQQKAKFMRRFLKIDDVAVIGFIQLLKDDCTDSDIKDLAGRLIYRNLHKSLDVREIVENRLRDECPSIFPAIEDTGGSRQAGASIYWSQIRAIVEKEILKASSKIRESLGEGFLQDVVSRKAYKESQPIMVVIGGKLVDLSEISPVVRDLGEHHVHRIYFRKEDREKATEQVDKWLDSVAIEWRELHSKVTRKEKEWLETADSIANIGTTEGA